MLNWFRRKRPEEPASSRAEVEVQLYRKALQTIANWNTLKDTADTNLIKSFARASLNAIPDEARAATGGDDENA